MLSPGRLPLDAGWLGWQETPSWKQSAQEDGLGVKSNKVELQASPKTAERVHDDQ
jgi:hypothetical protein